MLVLFVAKHAAVLVLVLVTAAGAGTLAVGSREGIALRTALGLALCGHACFFLAAVGQLRAAPLIALTVVAITAGAWRARTSAPPFSIAAVSVLGFLPLFVLALYPPLAFDETLYHLPFVRALTRDGALSFLPNLRFPVFPQIHELLCVPLFLLAGDVATHLVALAEVLITAVLLIEWGRRYGTRAGWLAAALFLGSPLVVHLATITYVDAALTLFVAAGFYALDREQPALAGLFLGTACSVKYLGGYFAIAALIIVIARAADRRRSVAVFTLACAATALPTTAWIAMTTHNPVFPFLGRSLWALPPSPAIALGERVIGVLRTIWDVTFARDRVNFQPPVTPLLIALVVVVIAATLRDVRARCVVLLSTVYLVLFSFLPHDSRYLVPLLPLVSVIAAIAVATRWPKAATLIAIVAIAPGIAYAGYRIAILGMPPVESWERNEWLARRVPAYPALLRAGNERVYVCGGEQLKDYAGGELLGDYAGPFSYERILGGTDADGTVVIARRLRSIDVRYFLVVNRVCGPMRASGGMTLTYEDAAAQLWRVQPLAAR
jgi:Protein of unknown function (DUF2029).